MPDRNKCPQCGAPLPAGALAGFCPACLLKQGAAADTAPGSDAAPFTPPPVAELAKLFPQLEILGLIGQGGMGAVYKARQKQLDRIVALKILPPAVSHDPKFAERFAREARALAKLTHPNIVTLYEFGQADGLFYFLMEFMDGMNLRQLLSAGRVTPKEALAIVPPICDALQFAHDRGIVHRDIKPENILLSKAGQVKIADFGVAKIVAHNADIPVREGGEARTGMSALQTDASLVMGTPQYMAPEQTEHPSEVDHRADIYSLGVVFYQMLTGELPKGKFEAPSKKVVIDVRLDEVVLRALEKEPERRYQQVSEVKTQVETIAATEGAGVPPAKPGVATSPTKQSLLWMFFGEHPEQRHLNWPFWLFYLSTLGLWVNGIFLAIELVPWLLNVGNASITPAGVWEKLLWIAACVVGRQTALVALNWNSKTVGWAGFTQKTKSMTTRTFIVLLLTMVVAAVVAAGVAILTPWMRAKFSTAFADVSSLTSIARVVVWIALAVTVGWLIIRRVRRAANKPLGSDGLPRASSPGANQPLPAGASSGTKNKSGMVRIIEIFFGDTFTSPLAIKLINISALGFLGSLGSLGFLGYGPPGWHWCFGFSGFSGFFGFFGLIGVAVIVETTARRRLRATPSPTAGSEPAAAIEEIRKQVKGPAIGLIATAILNWIAIPAIVMAMVFVGASPNSLIGDGLVVVPIAAFVLGTVMLVGALKMKRLESPTWAVTASMLAMFIAPGNIIGLPLGIWAMVVLGRPEVRAAFRQKRPPQEPTSHDTLLGRLALGLFIGGLLGTILIMAVSPWQAMALIFGAVALVLAMAFGLMGRRERLGRLAVFCVLVALVGVPTSFFSAFWTEQACSIVTLVPRVREEERAHIARAEAMRSRTARASTPVIERVRVSVDKAVIEGRGAPDAKFVFQVGQASFKCSFHNDSSFTANIERAWWGRGLNFFIKDLRGNVLLNARGNKVGPMTEQRGDIIFREGMLAPQPDGSFILGEFRPKTGAPFPVAARVETSSKPTASPADVKPAPRLQFRLVADANDTAPADTLADPGSKQPLRVHKEVLLDESAVARAAVVVSPERAVSVEVEFNDAGSNRFAEITGANIGKRLAVIFGGKVLSAPTIMSVIRDKAVITGNFTAVEVAEVIANALNAGKGKPLLGADLTQDVVKDLQPDGSIRFKLAITQRNTTGEPFEALRFYNSDYIHLDKLTDAQGREIRFSVTRTGKTTLRYEALLTEPVKPDAEFSYVMGGTETGLVKPLPKPGEFEYTTRHWPGNIRTRRIERHLLPASARLLSKSPAELVERTRDGRVELFIDRMIPAGDSLEISYRWAKQGE